MNLFKVWPVLAGLLLIGSAVRADADPWRLGIFGGQFYAESDTDLGEDSFALRAERHLAGRWSVGSNLSWLPIDAGGGEDVDAFFLDVSASYALLERERFGLSLSGGPGLVRVDFREAGVSETSEELTLHLGLGLDIGITQRLYLRPDLRGRWIDAGSDDLHTEASLGLGFRF